MGKESVLFKAPFVETLKYVTTLHSSSLFNPKCPTHFSKKRSNKTNETESQIVSRVTAIHVAADELRVRARLAAVFERVQPDAAAYETHPFRNATNRSLFLGFEDHLFVFSRARRKNLLDIFWKKTPEVFEFGTETHTAN